MVDEASRARPQVSSNDAAAEGGAAPDLPEPLLEALPRLLRDAAQPALAQSLFQALEACGRLNSGERLAVAAAALERAQKLQEYGPVKVTV